ncbi:hypothetical protein N7478_013026 [Penicillium angulare]|uniref:uncharacterized protein n=1 Tax=Penicillium angulare TaxID=116970 RepID=UPI002541B7CC|nr:uncharacterized protein N7478_013026 [Penicillium angulare]KAJ5256922.1 hypothetical protein N7478_013026 [Penicillium angulare]
MSLHTSFHDGDSDADDEYERSVITSPHLQTDSEASPIDSDIPSSEHTPTKFGYPSDIPRTPRAIISEWTANECIEFLTSQGLLQYCETFRENGIVGEALIALRHDELKEMGINSVGHRLTILKSVYEIKVRQNVPLDVDHYIPLSADQSMNENATQDDIARLIQSIQIRDQKIYSVETELRRLADEYRRLREEILPMIKMAKDRSQPLPPPSSSMGSSTDNYSDSATLISPSQITVTDNSSSSKLARAFSKRAYGGNTPKTNSPTHIPPSVYEGRNYHDGGNLDPSAAAMTASSHLSASRNSGLQPSPGVPSPTSPNAHISQHQTLNPRSYNQPGSTLSRAMYDHPEETPRAPSRSDRLTPSQPLTARTETPSSGSRIDSRGAGPSSVEIFKSFRVSWEDPCYKVLPAALRKYNINHDPKDYALYIVYGDQERCLGLDEKPLLLFKQLEREGRKPMFMLRRIHPENPYPPPTGSAPPSAGFESGGRPGQINLPGGVL